jgi:F0F1-type ATP synthase beta subunit
VIDLLTPIQKGGSVGLEGPPNERKALLMMELINNTSKAHYFCYYVIFLCNLDAEYSTS